MCFNINQLIQTTCLRHAHLEFYMFDVGSSEENEENPPSTIKTQLTHEYMMQKLMNMEN